MRFVNYCKSTENSYIYVDATGSIAKAVPNQNKPYLYLICFKDGDDASNLLPLAGALLTDHSTVSISYWLSMVRQGIAIVNGTYVRSTFVVIDFSPALLNSILLSFNETNIKSYLRWCYNAVHKNYTSEQLSSVSVVRFCCAHVMHAFARSVAKLKLDKDIRAKAIMAFAILLNGNEFDQIYELISSIVHIFGSEDNGEAEKALDELISVGVLSLLILHLVFSIGCWNGCHHRI